MKTKAVRIYGENDLRLEEFELPQMKEDEILLKVVSDSICMSTYKAAMQGAKHKRVPNDVAEHPTIVGHVFCGEIVEVGSYWKDRYHPGQRVTIQPGRDDALLVYYSDNAAEHEPIIFSVRNDLDGDLTKAIVGRVIWAWSDVRNK